MPLTKKTVDHSNKECYAFSFYCDRCGKVWRSEETSFEAANNFEIESSEACSLLWAQERRIAFERANLEAQFHFNHCPDCGRWVCDDCFRPLGSEKCDLCCDCEKDSKMDVGKQVLVKGNVFGSVLEVEK